jgi:hypothetical protein
MNVQINKLEVRVGTTINLGDYQSVKAEILIGADLEPREDDSEAFNALRKKATVCVLELLRDNHPNNHRGFLSSGATPLLESSKPEPSTNGDTVEEKAKRTRRTKEQIAADNAKAEAEQRAKLAAEQLKTDVPDEDDDMAALLGDSIPDHPKVTAAEAKAMAGAVIKALGGPALVKLLGDYKAKNFSELPEEQYGAFHAKAKAMVGTA